MPHKRRSVEQPRSYPTPVFHYQALCGSIAPVACYHATFYGNIYIFHCSNHLCVITVTYPMSLNPLSRTTLTTHIIQAHSPVHAAGCARSSYTSSFSS
jgi:hypothetical protein